jgi:GR25 family glycosyltransferase involved in LPS biosynthesis
MFYNKSAIMCDEKLIGYYINLDKRSDRKYHFEQNVKCHSFFSNIERMSAIYHDVRGAGCTLSHIECLRKIKIMRNNIDDETKLPKYYAIMEDDFLILDLEHFNHFINKFQNIKYDESWDMILLTPRGEKMKEVSPIMDSNDYAKIIKSQTTTGYILKPHMIDILLENFISSYVALLNNGDYHFYALDQTWKTLQLNYNFYYYKNIFAGQLPGWSDLEEKYVDYNYGYLIQ